MTKEELLKNLEEIRAELKSLLNDLRGGKSRKRDWRRLKHEVSN